MQLSIKEVSTAVKSSSGGRSDDRTKARYLPELRHADGGQRLCGLRARRLARRRTSPNPSPRPRGQVLESLAASIGPVPRVILPDTADGTTEPRLVNPSSPEMPPPADRPVRVQLLGEIARGGMGVVLKGRDPDLGRDLAVKVLLESHKEKPDLVRRFVEEAQIGGQLQHPGVVPVYELGTFGDRRPYFTMKLVKGQTLAELLADRESPADDLPRFLGDLRADLPDDGLRACPRRDPPRPEAVQRDGGQLRRGAGDGLGPGQGPAQRRRGRRRRGRARCRRTRRSSRRRESVPTRTSRRPGR